MSSATEIITLCSSPTKYCRNEIVNSKKNLDVPGMLCRFVVGDCKDSSLEQCTARAEITWNTSFSIV